MFFAVSDIACHYSDNINILYAVFFINTVIPQYHIVILTYFNYSMKYIFIGRSFVQYNISFFAPFPISFCYCKKFFSASYLFLHLCMSDFRSFLYIPHSLLFYHSSIAPISLSSLIVLFTSFSI